MLRDGLREPLVEGLELVEPLGVVVVPALAHRPEADRAAHDGQPDARVRLAIEHPLDVRQGGRHRVALEQLRMRDVAVDVDDHVAAPPSPPVASLPGQG